MSDLQVACPRCGEQLDPGRIALLLSRLKEVERKLEAAKIEALLQELRFYSRLPAAPFHQA